MYQNPTTKYPYNIYPQQNMTEQLAPTPSNINKCKGKWIEITFRNNVRFPFNIYEYDASNDLVKGDMNLSFSEYLGVFTFIPRKYILSIKC